MVTWVTVDKSMVETEPLAVVTFRTGVPDENEMPVTLPETVAPEVASVPVTV